VAPAPLSRGPANETPPEQRMFKEERRRLFLAKLMKGLRRKMINIKGRKRDAIDQY
tara:strand:- start:75 stop:242 length:168 start_codon:yes stop_codon:yes gene_type:complete